MAKAKMSKEVKKESKDKCVCECDCGSGHGCDHNSPFVGIPAAMGGIFMIIAVLFLIFANDSLNILISIVWAFVVMAIVGMFFAVRAHKKQ